MKKNKKKSVKAKNTNIIKRIMLACFLLISISLNIFQGFLYRETQSNADDIAWRLNNYRDLQNTQINAVRQNCRRINETVIEPLGLYSGVLKDYDTSLSTEYATNVKLRCRFPALLIAGYIDFHNNLSEYDAAIEKLFIPHSYILSDDAFDDVRW